MIAATIGTVLMIAMVVTSLVIVRQRFRYEAWYAVHLLVIWASRWPGSTRSRPAMS